MPIINFCFCGTGLNPARPGLATVNASKQFEDTILLPGPGSDTKIDAESKTTYYAPGTYKHGQDGKPTPRHTGPTSLFAGKLSLGYLRGTGEDDNIEYCVQEIAARQQQVSHDEKIVINLVGYSRGAASAIRLANKLYELYGNTVEVNLYLMDPNAGFGRHNSLRKTNIPPNVANAYFAFSLDDKSKIYKSRGLAQYHFHGNTQVTSIGLPGDHEQQELTRRGETPPLAAQCNEHYIFEFLKQHGAIEKDSAVPPIIPILSDKLESLQASQEVFATKGLNDNVLHSSMRLPFILQQFSIISSQPDCLSHFVDVINQIDPSEIKFRQYSYLLLCELSADYRNAKNDLERQSILLAAEKATEVVSIYNVIVVMQKDPEHNQALLSQNIVDLTQAINDFAAAVQIDTISHSVKATAAKLVGCVIGSVAAILGGVVGFIAGVRNLFSADGGCIATAIEWGARGFTIAKRATERNLNDNSIEDKFSNNASQQLI